MNTPKSEQNLAAMSLGEIMERAYRKHVVVPAFNIPYLPMVRAVAEVLRECETFALLEVARPDINRFEAGSFRAIKEEYDRWADRSVSRLHQDHVPVVDEEGKEVDWESLIKEALDLGYDSVMIDGSRLSLAENIRITRVVVDMAHARDVLVEAELGSVLGHEAGPLPPYEELFVSGKGFTSPEEAKRFVDETGVDWLSVAVGNIHGAISGAARDNKKMEACLNIDHLDTIARMTNRPLVLHGGSGIQKTYVLQAIAHGITKINVGTEIRQAYEQGFRKNGKIEEAIAMLQERTEALITDYYGIRGSIKLLMKY
ncbi:MAG TPA: class II fructose-bisphosphate aldolase [Atribacteraceae bacterium]|nr:class II fructose-bisphosphate aldolase [Atribacteraceae bacterium]